MLSIFDVMQCFQKIVNFKTIIVVLIENKLLIDFFLEGRGGGLMRSFFMSMIINKNIRKNRTLVDLRSIFSKAT